MSEVRDGHADLANLATRHLVVRVITRLGGQVERDRQAGLALGQVGAVELVGCRSSGMAGIGPHHPRAIAFTRFWDIGGRHGRRIAHVESLVGVEPFTKRT